MLPSRIRTGVAIVYFVAFLTALAVTGELSPLRLLTTLAVAVLEAARRRFLPYRAMAVAVAGFSCAAAVLDPQLIGLAPAAALALAGSTPARAAAGILFATVAIVAPAGAGLHTAGATVPSLGSRGILVLLAAGLGLLEYVLARLEAAEDENLQLQNTVAHLHSQSREQQLAMQQGQHALAGRIELTERNRIARALHDALGHGLTGALWQLRAADELLERGDSAGARTSLQRGVAAVDEGLAAIRATVRDLRPREVPDLEAMQRLADEFAYCPVQLRFTGDPARIPGGVLSVFCDNLRELLTNTMRHSGADRVEIVVSQTAGFYRLEYRDNGVGLQSAEQQHIVRPGMGLDSIRSRTLAIGGRCTFGTAAGNGFVCVCLVQGEAQ